MLLHPRQREKKKEEKKKKKKGKKTRDTVSNVPETPLAIRETAWSIARGGNARRYQSQKQRKSKRKKSGRQKK
jgi:hypothetical protein